MGIQIAEDGLVFSVGVESEYLNINLTFVDWLDGGGANALLENKGLIAVSDEPCDVDAYGECDVYNISSLRTCLDTSKLICFYVQSPQKSFNFFLIQETSISFVVFKSNFQCVGFVSLRYVQ